MQGNIAKVQKQSSNFKNKLVHTNRNPYICNQPFWGKQSADVVDKIKLGTG